MTGSGQVAPIDLRVAGARCSFRGGSEANSWRMNRVHGVTTGFGSSDGVL